MIATVIILCIALVCAIFFIGYLFDVIDRQAGSIADLHLKNTFSGDRHAIRTRA
ncbi:MAG: hypothetical protein ACYC4K_10400 [Thiobacillus sp.]